MLSDRITMLIWRQIAERDGRQMRSPLQQHQAFRHHGDTGTTADQALAEDFIGDRLLACGSILLLRGDDDLGY